MPKSGVAPKSEIAGPPQHGEGVLQVRGNANRPHPSRSNLHRPPTWSAELFRQPVTEVTRPGARPPGGGPSIGSIPGLNSGERESFLPTQIAIQCVSDTSCITSPKENDDND